MGADSLEDRSLMDRNFLEFWGNLLLSAAKGQEELEAMAKWIRQGLSGFEYLNDMFRKFYGIDRHSEDSPDYLQSWKKAERNFYKSLEDYLSLFGVVPREEHLELLKEYEELKAKAAAQEETIKHLRMLHAEKGFAQSEMISGLQELMVEQGEQFRKLMESFSDLYITGKNDS